SYHEVIGDFDWVCSDRSSLRDATCSLEETVRGNGDAVVCWCDPRCVRHLTNRRRENRQLSGAGGGLGRAVAEPAVAEGTAEPDHGSGAIGDEDHPVLAFGVAGVGSEVEGDGDAFVGLDHVDMVQGVDDPMSEPHDEFTAAGSL